VAGGRTTDELCERRCARRLSNPTGLGQATAGTRRMPQAGYLIN